MQRINVVYEKVKETKNYAVYQSSKGIYDVLGAIYVRLDTGLMQKDNPEKICITVEPVCKR